MTIFFARELTAGDAQPEDDESIEYELMPLPKVVDMISLAQFATGRQSLECCGWLNGCVAVKAEPRPLQH